MGAEDDIGCTKDLLMGLWLHLHWYDSIPTEATGCKWKLFISNKQNYPACNGSIRHLPPQKLRCKSRDGLLNLLFIAGTVVDWIPRAQTHRHQWGILSGTVTTAYSKEQYLRFLNWYYVVLYAHTCPKKQPLSSKRIPLLSAGIYLLPCDCRLFDTLPPSKTKKSERSAAWIDHCQEQCNRLFKLIAFKKGIWRLL